MSKEEKLSEKFLIFVGRCNGASLTEFNISNFNDEARIIANGIDRYEKHIADLETKLAESESKRKSLEEKIKFLTEETEENFVDGQKYNQLKHQLAITEKALELACERVKYFEEMQDKEMGFYAFFGYDSDYDLKAIIEQYKQQAKEMLENEYGRKGR